MQPRNAQKRYSLGDIINLYENNYSRLICLLPASIELSCPFMLAVEGMFTVRIELLEKSRYTCLVSLQCCWDIEGPWIDKPYMRVRLYHDAQVADVIASQQYSGFHARNVQPNPKFFGVYEKRQVNLFLGEWLDCCLSRRRQFISESHLTSV